jgi:polyisoprenyl-phosphate glycosyltransferase
MTDISITSKRIATAISCVMPAYNEAGNLGLVVPRVLNTLGKLSQQVELIIVNDGSRDATEQVLADLCAKHPQVVALNLSRNFGKEPALTAGFKR